MGDFNSPDHLNYLDERIAEMESKVVIACEDAAKLRATLEAFITPIAKVIFTSPTTKKHAAGRLLTPRGRHVAIRRGNVVNAATANRHVTVNTTDHTLGASMNSAAPAAPSLPGLSPGSLASLLESVEEEEEGDRQGLAAALLEEDRVDAIHKDAYVRAQHAGRDDGRVGAGRDNQDKSEGWRAKLDARLGKANMTSGKSGGRAGIGRDGGGEDLENTAVMGAALM